MIPSDPKAAALRSKRYGRIFKKLARSHLSKQTRQGDGFDARKQVLGFYGGKGSTTTDGGLV